jgi:pyruvate/2-oxoglutarate dehydrogenase complex dihydrolipoamide acyltransferase (E2) component
VATIAAAHHESWRALYQRNTGVIGSNPNLIFPGEVLALSGSGAAAPAATATPAAKVTAPAAAKATATPAAKVTAPAAAKPAAPAAVQAAAPVRAAAAAPAATATAHITNSAGSVKPQAQAAADQVVSNVPGAAGITLGGTRASAVDPHGHPSGLAVDYMVLSDSALGNAIVQYHIAHWNELGVEYLIYKQRILTSPTGAWKAMADRGSATANHMDHVHVNYTA